ncbi:hypothetical protein INVICTA_140 [Cronobacter phage vB_CsaM_Invicta]|nr:hypothetical protein INVICTA_140 [Cronobacter phage vB_CsaM_Invicta]
MEGRFLMKKYFIEAADRIVLALLNWNRRQDVSIMASTNGTTYDRYDPARGLHKPYEVKE